MKRLVLLALMMGGCATTPPVPPEPVIITKEVMVPVQVPCAALKALGPEPAYPDTDAAIKAAGGLYDRVLLITRGRLMRLARLAEYSAAKASCL
jgi:hypothetical protein